MSNHNQEEKKSDQIEEESISLIDLLVTFTKHKKKILLVPILAGVVAVVYSLLLPDIFSARTTFVPIPPKVTKLNQQGQLYHVQSESKANTAKFFKRLLLSQRIQDKMISKFGLSRGTDEYSVADAREELQEVTTISLESRDNILTVEVENEEPERAAQLANGYASMLAELIAELIAELDSMSPSNENSIKKGQLQKMEQEEIPSNFQILDVAIPPVKRVRPRRTQMVLMTVIVCGFMMCLIVLMMETKERVLGDPSQAEKVEEVRRNLSRF